MKFKATSPHTADVFQENPVYVKNTVIGSYLKYTKGSRFVFFFSELVVSHFLQLTMLIKLLIICKCCSQFKSLQCFLTQAVLRASLSIRELLKSHDPIYCRWLAKRWKLDSSLANQISSEKLCHREQENEPTSWGLCCLRLTMPGPCARGWPEKLGCREQKKADWH